MHIPNEIYNGQVEVKQLRTRSNPKRNTMDETMTTHITKKKKKKKKKKSQQLNTKHKNKGMKGKSPREDPSKNQYTYEHHKNTNAKMEHPPDIMSSQKKKNKKEHVRLLSKQSSRKSTNTKDATTYNKKMPIEYTPCNRPTLHKDNNISKNTSANGYGIYPEHARK